MKKQVQVDGVGLVTLVKYKQAKAYTLRVNRGQVRVSLPWYGSYRQALSLVESNKESLERIVSKQEENKTNLPSLNQLKQEAQAYLPGRLLSLSQKHQLPYLRLRIGKSTSYWGRCSSNKSILLSCYLMILPEELIDYVLLHELCHTKEMNHGSSFWALMDQVTEGKAAYYRKQIRKMKIG